jgi:hypothetical protein
VLGFPLYRRRYPQRLRLVAKHQAPAGEGAGSLSGPTVHLCSVDSRFELSIPSTNLSAELTSSVSMN